MEKGPVAQKTGRGRTYTGKGAVLPPCTSQPDTSQPRPQLQTQVTLPTAARGLDVGPEPRLPYEGGFWSTQGPLEVVTLQGHAPCYRPSRQQACSYAAFDERGRRPICCHYKRPQQESTVDGAGGGGMYIAGTACFPSPASARSPDVSHVRQPAADGDVAFHL